MLVPQLCPQHMHKTHSCSGRIEGSTTTHWFPTHTPSKCTSELPSTAMEVWGGCQPQLQATAGLLMASPQQGAQHPTGNTTPQGQ